MDNNTTHPSSTPIVSLSQEQPALLLQAFYKSNNIQATIQKTSEGFQLSVENHNDVNKAIELTKEFLAQPNADKLQQAAWESGEVSSNSGSLFKGFAISNLNLWRQQLVTCAIALACIGIYILMNIGFAEVIFKNLRMLPLSQLLSGHEWWRVFGPNIMHGSAMHLLFNMAGWWFFAGVLERSFGSVAMIVLFSLSTLFTNLIYTAIWGPNFIGLSGVVFSLFGFLWLIDVLRPHWKLSIPKGLVVMVLISLGLGLSGLLGNVSNAGHILGLISGLAMALAVHQATPDDK